MGLLTYMSIQEEIQVRMGEGRLWQLKPILDSDPVVRTMIISKEIKDLIVGPWEDVSWERRCNRLRANLEAFIRGDVISLCLRGFEARSAYMGRLDRPADEVWDIRSRSPSPALRVFGRFADKDVFVALFWSPRSLEVPYSQRLPLGDRNSTQWRSAMRETKTEWRKLFHTYQPIHGDSHNVYASNAISV
jgi:hypothetical protein